MNLYFLVEGDRTETKLYRRWIGHALPHLSEVSLVGLGASRGGGSPVAAAATSIARRR